MFDLKEKVCLVTGASRGIGLALIKAFLKRGAFCLMVDVDYKVRLLFVISTVGPRIAQPQIVWFDYNMINSKYSILLWN